jgi:hypothetical protein
LARIFDESFGASSQMAGAKGVLDKASPVHSLEGSQREVKDPLVSMINHALSLITRANQARVARSVADFAESVEGSGWFANKVEGPTEKPGKKVVLINRNGNKEYWELDDSVYKVMSEMDKEVIPAALKMIGATTAAKLVRLGAVELRTAFALKQFIMDPIDAWVKSRSGIPTPFHAMAEIVSVMRRSASTKEFEALGGAISTFMGTDLRQQMSNVDRLVPRATGDQVMHNLTHPHEMIKHAAESVARILGRTDMASRVLEYRRLLEQNLEAMKRGERPGWTEEDAVYDAMLGGKDITINFTRAGTVGAFVNQLTPFFNARLQGVSKDFRSFFGANGVKPAVGAWTKAIVGITGLSLVNWLFHHNDEWYQKTDPRVRDHWWLFSFDGGKHIISLPKPQGVMGLVFGGTAEAGIEALHEKDPALAKQVAWDVVQDAVPYKALPTLLQAWIEMRTNHDFLTERPIESAYEQEGKKVQNRAGVNTTGVATRLAKTWLAEFFGLSPKKIDVLMSDLTGGAALDMARMVDLARGAKSASVQDIPILGAFMKRDPITGGTSKTVQEFYDRRTELHQLHGSRELGANEEAERHHLDRVAAAMAKIRKERESGKRSLEQANTEIDRLATQAMGAARR